MKYLFVRAFGSKLCVKFHLSGDQGVSKYYHLKWDAKCILILQPLWVKLNGLLLNSQRFFEKKKKVVEIKYNISAVDEPCAV